MRWIRQLRTLCRSRLFWLVVLVLVLARFAMDQIGLPLWDRPSERDRFSSPHGYIHVSGAELYISDQAADGVGYIRFVHLVTSQDSRIFLTRINEWRHLHVVINGHQLNADETRAWRWRALLHFKMPLVLLEDGDVDRTLWLGYPCDWLRWLGRLACGALFLVGAIALELLLVELNRCTQRPRPDPRLKAVSAGYCPTCGYDIRFLPVPRCPECGDSWPNAATASNSAMKSKRAH